MLDFNEIIEDIRDNGGFYSNSKEDSFYRVYKTQGFKPIQVRISNHGTHLWTWIDRNYDPSRATVLFAPRLRRKCSHTPK